MTCAEFRARMDGFVTGVLAPAESAAFEAHLEHCRACEEWLAREEPVPAGASALPRSIAPASDLWPGIRQRIDRPARSIGRITVPRWALAAAAMGLVALSSGVTAALLRSPDAAPAVVRGVNALEAQYAEASRDLSRLLEDARATLAPETMTVIEKNLAIIDAALGEAREALSRDPGNEALGQMVVVAWRQKVDLLRRATAFGTKS
jgi:hypothetical protein